MTLKIDEAIDKFQKRASKVSPHITFTRIEPFGEADVSFRATFPEKGWAKELYKLTEISTDIEEELDVWITLLAATPAKQDRAE